MAWPINLIPPFPAWWPFRRQPTDVTDVPGVTRATARDGEAQTGQQQQGVYGTGSVPLMYCEWERACCQPVPVGDYPIYRAMDADPALTVSRAVITAPIRETDKGYEAREGTPDDWLKLAQSSVDPLWDAWLPEALDSLSMGWKPFEKVYGRKDGRTAVVDLKPLAQELTEYLVRGNEFAGLRNLSGDEGRPIDLPPELCLVVTCDGKNRNPYGRAWHENGIAAWWKKLACLVKLAKLNDKASGIQVKVFYPPAADEATNHTNEKKAKELAAAYMRGEGAVVPNATGSLTPDLAADFRNIQGLAEAALWKIEIEDHGDTGPQAASILDQIRYHNTELSRSWHVPERAAQEAITAGSRADSETNKDTATAMSQLVYNDLCAAVSRQVIDPLLMENFGERARGAVWLKAGKLRDVFAQADWKLIDSVLKDPDLFLAVAEQVDLDAVFTRRGIPKLKSTLTLNEAVQERRRQKEQERKLQQQTAGAGKVNENGGGRLAMARGMEYIGRLFGDEE